MANCAKCGESLKKGAKFCPSCGAAAGGTAKSGGRSASSNTRASQADIDNNKGMAIIAYLLFFIPLITGDHRKSAYVKFHTNQGTVLFIGWVAWGIASFILRTVLRAILWRGLSLWGIWSLISLLISLAGWLPLILCILGIINAVNGKMNPLPIIGKFTVIK